MTLRARLALGFLTIAILLAVPLAEALYALQQVRATAKELSDHALTASLRLAKTRTVAASLRQADASILALQGDTTATAYLERQVDSLVVMADSLERFRLDSVVPTLRASAAEIRQWGRIEAAARHDRQGDLADRVSDQHITPAIIAVEDRILSAEKTLSERSRQQVEAAATVAGDAWRVAGLLLVIALLVGAAVAIWTTSSISRPVKDLERGMQEVADGNFTHELSIGPGRDDEFGRLASSFQSMAGQLAELDKIKAEFVSVASHELKTPINVIMGYLKLLEENLYGSLNERQAEVVGIMETQADALARLVQHLLDVSRFQAGAARLEARPMTLRGFLTQLEATYEVLAMQRGVTFNIAASDSLPEVVTWDIDRANEVLGNLLSNAFKFTEPGGRVDLVVSSLEDAVYIEVRDTGVGIAPAQLPHIFDKFFQADNQHTTGTKGSGLGLAISKEIVEAHGGSIAAESTVGVGTKFSIMLPVSASPAGPAGGRNATRHAPNDEPHTAGATA
jgi:signal transduction histidine kinase